MRDIRRGVVSVIDTAVERQVSTLPDKKICDIYHKTAARKAAIARRYLSRRQGAYLCGSLGESVAHQVIHKLFLQWACWRDDFPDVGVLLGRDSLLLHRVSEGLDMRHHQLRADDLCPDGQCKGLTKEQREELAKELASKKRNGSQSKNHKGTKRTKKSASTSTPVEAAATLPPVATEWAPPSPPPLPGSSLLPSYDLSRLDNSVLSLSPVKAPASGSKPAPPSSNPAAPLEFVSAAKAAPQSSAVQTAAAAAQPPEPAAQPPAASTPVPSKKPAAVVGEAPAAPSAKPPGARKKAAPRKAPA